MEKPLSPKEEKELLRILDMAEVTAIGFASGYQVYTKFMESCIHLMQQIRMGGMVSTISGPALMDARRDIVEGFLDDTACKYLLMLDTDMEFSAQDVLTALSHMAYSKSDPCVSGLYVDSSGFPVAGNFVADGGYKPLAHPPTGPTPVDAVGCGFLVIPRWVLESIPRGTWFDHTVLPPNDLGYSKVLGEDVSFCKRASSVGARILLDPSIYLAHLKVRRLYPDGTNTP